MPIILEGGGCIAEASDVVAWYRAYLGRDPEFDPATAAQIGQPCDEAERSIRCSEEASNLRTAQGLGPDPFCAPPPPPPPTAPVAPPPPAPPPAAVLPPFDLSGLLQPFEGLTSGIGSEVQGIAEQLGGFKDAITRDIEALIRRTESDALRLSKELAGGIDAVVKGLVPTTLQIVGFALGGFETLLAAFVSNAATVDDIAGGFIEAVRGQAGNLAGFIGPLGENVLRFGLNAALHSLEQEAPERIDPLLDRIAATPGLPPELRTLLGGIQSREAPIFIPLLLLLFGAVLGGLASGALSPVIDRVTQTAVSVDPVVPLTPAELADLVIREVLTQEEAAGQAQRSGVSAENFGRLVELAKRPPAVEQAIEARNRQIIDDAGLDGILRRSFLPRDYYDMVKRLALRLPSIGDTINFAVREVFNPELRRALTLDAEYPDELTAKARALNLAEGDARDYWAAHWVLPSLGELFDMEHRGIITRDEVRAAVKANDFAPVWRDRLIELSFNVLTRVDIRRVHRALRKDHAWLLEQHKRLGYDADTAELLSVFVETINSHEKKAELKDLTDGLKSRVVSATIAGTLSESDARTYLAELGYASSEIDAFFAEARLFRAGKRADRIREIVGDLYIRGLWTWDRARGELQERGFIVAELEPLKSEWDLERELHAPRDQTLKGRDLTTGELIAAYEAHILTLEQTREHLKSLRFDEGEIDTLLALADYRREQEDMKLRIEVLHRKIVTGKITELQATVELDRLGLRPTRRDALLARWELEKSSKTADIPAATVADLFRRGIWDVTQVDEYLMHLGFDDFERDALLRLWGAQAAERAQRTATAATRRGV